MQGSGEDWEQTTFQLPTFRAEAEKSKKYPKKPWATRNKHLEHLRPNDTPISSWLRGRALAIQTLKVVIVQRKTHAARPEWVTSPAEHTLR